MKSISESPVETFFSNTFSSKLTGIIVGFDSTSIDCCLFSIEYGLTQDSPIAPFVFFCSIFFNELTCVNFDVIVKLSFWQTKDHQKTITNISAGITSKSRVKTIDYGRLFTKLFLRQIIPRIVVGNLEIISNSW